MGWKNDAECNSTCAVIFRRIRRGVFVDISVCMEYDEAVPGVPYGRRAISEESECVKYGI